ncbi:MAG: ribosome maturation factor RimM [Candidatus Krumholzibacteria bacterium]|nr:ribosome maturation factor RimM [Candidatus Krumholzibacteria bacterium]
MADTAILGTIVKIVGLKGEVKLLPAPDFWLNALAADALDVVGQTGERRTVHVARRRPKGETFILKFDGIDTAEAAERLIGSSLEVSLEALGGATPPDELLPCQLIGLDVALRDGTPFGVVVDMLLGSAQDCLVIEKDAERYLVPYVPDIVRKISIEDGMIEIDPPEGLLDLRW